jgi:hypothetical protein
MLKHLLIAAASLFSNTVALSQQLTEKLSSSHDGHWSVSLACADIKGSKGLIKGYDYNFAATINGGKLEGQYGTAGSPASLKYIGYVLEDGSLEIKASGNTGLPEYAVGKVATGTAYTYTMQGRLNQSSGQALRKELRPCIATFTRQ